MLVATARRILAVNGCESLVGGHVSLRSHGEDAFYVSPFQYFDETRPEDVAKLSLDLDVLEGTMTTAPAAHFHAAIYRARPDVNSVVHTHSLWVSILSTTSQTVGAYHDDAAIFYRDQALHAEDGIAPPVADEKLVSLLGQDKHVIIMKNHGALVAETSIQDATVKALTLERCAQIQVWSQLIGGVEAPEGFIEQAKPKMEKYFLPLMWQSNLKRVARSDPDVFA